MKGEYRVHRQLFYRRGYIYIYSTSLTQTGSSRGRTDKPDSRFIFILASCLKEWFRINEYNVAYKCGYIDVDRVP